MPWLKDSEKWRISKIWNRLLFGFDKAKRPLNR